MCSFEKFVPNRVVKEILSQDIVAHLGVEPYNATVFFCDIEVKNKKERILKNILY